MEGEGFFQVAKDKKRPFSVYTGNVSTTAVGTSFNIRYSRNDSISKISLVTGVVKVKLITNTGKEEEILLKPGEEVKCRIDQGTFDKEKFDLMAVVGWKDNILYFKESGLNEVVKKLESWYGVNIELVGDPENKNTSDWSYTGQFKNQSLEKVLKGLSYTKNFQYKIDGKNVKIIFN